MGKGKINRILVSGIFVISVLSAADVMAQAAAGSSGSQQTHAHKSHNGNAAQHNPACEKVLEACKNAGFIQGQWKKDNGLWKDCFDPIVKGKGNVTRDGHPASVLVNSADVEACHASKEHHKQGGTPANK